MELCIIENPEILSECVVPYLDDALSFCRFSLLCKATWAFTQQYISMHPDIVQKDRGGCWTVLGVRHGKHTVDDICGYSQYRYINGLIEGKCNGYFNNTKIVRYFLQSEIHGPYIEKRLGMIITQGTYVHDKLQGPYMRYFKNGTIKKLAYFKNGRLSGKYKKYVLDPDGLRYLKAVVKYRNGEKHGYMRKYYPCSSVIRIACKYSHGVLHGNYSYYICDGKIYKSMQYRYGHKVQEEN
jgi:hypothetical protein